MNEQQAATEILSGVVAFSVIILLLVLLILLARRALIPSRRIHININQRQDISCSSGQKLLIALSDNGILLPSACGGSGTCGQCKVIVGKGGGEVLVTEKNHLTRREQGQGYRLACQLTVRSPLALELPATVFGAKKYHCIVRSNEHIASFLKELVLELPDDEQLDFRAGGYVQVECPPYRCAFAEFDIPGQYRQEWERLNLLRYQAGTDHATSRAYSMANYPGEGNIIMLNVRIATPPPRSPELPPGVVSSYIFSLKPGDRVTVAGPFGEFFARDTDAEMIFVGAGAGMAPMRSLILDQLLRLRSGRRIGFWYGARSRSEMPYVKEFDELCVQHGNFSWHAALSSPLLEDNWQGYTGYIHEVLREHYLRQHPAPEDCEYYLCGPPVMVTATIGMLEDLGVERSNIMLDDFGA